MAQGSHNTQPACASARLPGDLGLGTLLLYPVPQLLGLPSFRSTVWGRLEPTAK